MTGDLPKDKLVKLAEEIRKHPEKHFPDFLSLAGPDASVDVFFKHDCPKCKTRGMFETPNTIFEEMECSDCGLHFPFVEGGFTLAIHSK